MKKSWFLILTLALATSVVFAQDNAGKSSWVDAAGTATVGVGSTHGTDAVGGSSDGNAVGSFNAKGPHKATGAANANGSTLGTDSVTATSFATKSGTKVDSSAESNGLVSHNKVDGSAKQKNWGSVGNDSNFSGGWNSGTANYTGKNNAKNDPSVGGKAQTAGWTNGTAEDTGNARSATINSGSSSSANLDFSCQGTKKGSVRVTGGGEVGALSTVGGGPEDTSFGGASITGSTAFQATGDRSAAGKQSMTGSTAATTHPNGVSASAVETSTAKTGNGH